MIFRIIGITILKWLVVFIAIALAYAVIPPAFGSVLPLMAAWTATFFGAFLFATWIFHPSMPNRKTTWTIFAVWMIVTVTGYVVYVLRVSLLNVRELVSVQLLGQLVVESLAIFFASFIRKRRMLKQELGE